MLPIIFNNFMLTVTNYKFTNLTTSILSIKYLPKQKRKKKREITI